MNGVEISGPYPVHDMGKMIKGKPSLILTTTSANLFKHTSLPVITIMPTLEAEDVLAINQEISRPVSYTHLSSVPGHREDHQQKYNCKNERWSYHFK